MPWLLLVPLGLGLAYWGMKTKSVSPTLGTPVPAPQSSKAAPPAVTPAPKATPPAIVVAPGALATATVTTQSTNLNLHSGPGTNFPVIASIPKGKQVQVTGPAQSGPGATSWLPIIYSNVPGYGASDFLTQSGQIAPGVFRNATSGVDVASHPVQDTSTAATASSTADGAGQDISTGIATLFT